MSPASEAGDSLDDRRIAWACRELGLLSNADETDARRAFLTQVADEEFAPSEPLLQAFDVLRGDAQAPGPPAYASVERARINQRVDHFAERIFAMSPEERRKEWETLRACSGDWPRVTALLDRFRPALELDFERLKLSGEAEELAGYLRELFALPPFKRAERRSAIIEMCKSDALRWERAARRLAAKYPAIAALDPPLMERLPNWSRTEKVMRKPPRVKGPPQIKVTKRPFWNEGVSRHPWLLIVGLIVLVNVFRFAATTAENHPAQMPAYHSPPGGYEIDREGLMELLNRGKSKNNIESPASDATTIPNEEKAVPLDTDRQLEQSEILRRLETLYPPQGNSANDVELPASERRVDIPDLNQLIEKMKAAREQDLDVPAGENSP